MLRCIFGLGAFIFAFSFSGCFDPLDEVSTDICCEEDSDSNISQEQASPGSTLKISSRGLKLWSGDGSSGATLIPVAKIDGNWLVPELNRDCIVEAGDFKCSLSEKAVLRVSRTGSTVRVNIEALDALSVQAMGLQGTLRLPDAHSWLSNGFQSWSQSGLIGIALAPSEGELDEILLKQGDAEVLREGKGASWWYSYVGGGANVFVTGALSADLFKSWVQVSGEPGAGEYALKLVSGGAGESMDLSEGERVDSESWYLGVGPKASAVLEDFAAGLGARQPAPREERGDSTEDAAQADEKKEREDRQSDAADSQEMELEQEEAEVEEEVSMAPIGWNSWYDLWDTIAAEDIEENAALLKGILNGWPEVEGRNLRVVVDDGWQKAWGDWEANEKFPQGMKALADVIVSEGFAPGIWFAPVLVEASHPLATENPSWFVEGAQWSHPVHGGMLILDVGNPEAAAHLSAVVKRIVGWGYTLLKIDFLFAATFEGAHIDHKTGMAHYTRVLELIRESAGEDVEILAVGAPPVPTLQYVDSWRSGGDIAFENFDVSWAFIPNQLRSLAARWPYCTVTLCDADPPLFRELPENEVLFGSWVVALSGGAFFFSDDLRDLPSERIPWAIGESRHLLSASGRPAVPIGFFVDPAPATLSSPLYDQILGSSTQAAPNIWRMQDGRKLGFNMSDEPMIVDEISIPARSAVLLNP